MDYGVVPPGVSSGDDIGIGRSLAERSLYELEAVRVRQTTRTRKRPGDANELGHAAS